MCYALNITTFYCVYLYKGTCNLSAMFAMFEKITLVKKSPIWNHSRKIIVYFQISTLFRGHIKEYNYLSNILNSPTSKNCFYFNIPVVAAKQLTLDLINMWLKSNSDMKHVAKSESFMNLKFPMQLKHIV